ncbi:aminotransferase class IV [Paenibacillus beijingensis]|uniref:4-amino-4-deoxychorismate lyase n=1 Tax=Paenibacillus beijingensis TaxID=1126833 RepID=A0A0D5NIL5_9BACL|nr:aminotransferase class IV [Paenibacillus beijingensis]AJY74965.1 4-amino-4-deoxychorismate lyase [Paenibacillus beijingensis]
MKIGYNGSVVEAGDAKVSVYDHGFLYGIGLFETFRTYGGAPYLLERHLQRLAEGCRQLGIRWFADPAAIRRHLAELMSAHDLSEAYVRLTVSAGDEGLGLPAGDYIRPLQLLMVKPLPAPSAGLYREGRELSLLGTRRNSPEGGVRLKSLHFMNNVIAKRELLQSGAPAGAEGLMLTGEGWLAEGIVSNLFFAAGGVVKTPAVKETGILPGITRRRVLELAEAEGFPVEEGLYRWDELLAADEIWVTNSVQELVPVTKLADRSGMAGRSGNDTDMGAAKSAVVVGAGTIGPMCAKLLEQYRFDTDTDTGAGKARHD